MLEMSPPKRPWDDIGTVTSPSEIALVKRRAVSRLSIASILNDTSDDGDSSDQFMTSITEGSTPTNLSSVHSTLSVSSSPRKTTSPGLAQLGTVTGNIGEQGPSSKMICFGMVRSNRRFNLSG